METLLRDISYCMTCSAKCTQTVAICFLWEVSSAWKAVLKASALEEPVTDIATVWKAYGPAVHQGRLGLGWHRCSLKYQHVVPTTAEKITEVCLLPSSTAGAVAVTQAGWFRHTSAWWLGTTGRLCYCSTDHDISPSEILGQCMPHLLSSVGHKKPTGSLVNSTRLASVVCLAGAWSPTSHTLL